MPPVIVKTNEEFDKAFQSVSKMRIMGVDTETTGLDPYRCRVILVQIGDEYSQYVFDVARVGVENIKRLKPILENLEIVKILHNAKFDYRFIKTNFQIEMESMYDTMLAEQLLMKGKKIGSDKDDKKKNRYAGFSLLDVAQKYANVYMDKEMQQSFVGMAFGEEISEKQFAYAGEDVKHLNIILDSQKQLLERDGIIGVANIEMNAIQVTADMELNGLKIDNAKWMSAVEEAKKNKAQALIELNAQFGLHVAHDLFDQPDINYNSPKQLLIALKKALGPMGEKLTSTDESVLKDINHPAVFALLAYRGFEKQLTTYGINFLDNINPVTGRVHTNLSQLFTDTGRYSSDDPNLQNIPVKDTPIYRESFISRDADHRIIGADYSNMELRVLADLSGEEKWVTMFLNDNMDLHCEIGSMLFGKTIRKKGTNGPDDPGENVGLRKYAKSINFGVGG